MRNNSQILAKQWSEQRAWPDDPRTDQVTAQKARPHAQGYKRLFIVDLICILLVSIPFFLCKTNIVDPIHVGFSCNDLSISYPLKVQSIGRIILTCTSLFLTIISITLGELLWLSCQQVTSPVLISSTYMTVLYRELSAFLFGVTVNQSLSSIAKIFTGRLRPNFLAVCRPALAHLKCTHSFITHYNCTGAPAEVSMARKSFFSGQAAFSAYCVVYLMLYLQARLIWERSKWLRLMLQTILLPLPLLVGYLKIRDYWQHPSDIVVGFLQGLITAIWVAFFISDMFPSKRSLPPVSSSCSGSQDLSEQTSC